MQRNDLASMWLRPRYHLRCKHSQIVRIRFRTKWRAGRRAAASPTFSLGSSHHPTGFPRSQDRQNKGAPFKCAFRLRRQQREPAISPGERPCAGLLTVSHRERRAVRATHADNNLVAGNLNVEIGAVWPERDDRHWHAPTMTLCTPLVESRYPAAVKLA